MTREEWVNRHWDRVAPWLEQALRAHDLHTHDLEHVKAACISGDCQLWPTENSVVVVQIIEYPTGTRVMHLWLCGGDLEELLQTEGRLERYARANGFSAIMLTALRKGWQRALPGYVPAATELVKDLR